MEVFIIDILRQGTVAFLGCKITKAMGEKEISELIAAGGWAIVGISLVSICIPLFNGIGGFLGHIDSIIKTIQNIPGLG